MTRVLSLAYVTIPDIFPAVEKMLMTALTNIVECVTLAHILYLNVLWTWDGMKINILRVKKDYMFLVKKTAIPFIVGISGSWILIFSCSFGYYTCNFYTHKNNMYCATIIEERKLRLRVGTGKDNKNRCLQCLLLGILTSSLCVIPLHPWYYSYAQITDFIYLDNIYTLFPFSLSAKGLELDGKRRGRLIIISRNSVIRIIIGFALLYWMALYLPDLQISLSVHSFSCTHCTRHISRVRGRFWCISICLSMCWTSKCLYQRPTSK